MSTRHGLRRRAFLGQFGVVGLGLAVMPVLQACASNPAASPTAPPAATTPPEATAAPAATAVPTAAPAAAAEPANFILWTLAFDPFVNHQEKLISLFKEQAPDTTITLEKIADYWAKTPAAYAAGTEPDAIYHMGQVMLAYAVSDRLLPMPDDAIKAITGGASMEDTYWPAVLENWALEGKYYGVPEDYNYEGFNLLTVNNTLMQRHNHKLPQAWIDNGGPATYQEVLDFAKTITIKEGDRVKTPGLTSFYGWNSVKFWSLNFQLGADYRDYDAKRVKYVTDAGRQALQAHYDGLVTQGVDSFELGLGVDTFIKDANAFMGIGSPHWGPKLLLEQPDMDWTMMTFPAIFGENPYFSAAAAWGYWASKSTTEPDAVFEWFAFAGKPEHQADMSIAAGMVPPRKELVSDPKITSEDPQSRYFGPAVKIMDYGRAVPWFGAITGALESLYDTEAEAFFAGKISLDEALTNAETNTNAAIEQKLADLNL